MRIKKSDKGPVGQVGQMGQVGRMSHGMRASLALAVVVLLVGAAGCKKDTTVTPTTPTTPTVTRTTDTFSGTVPVRGSAFHSFAVTVTGTIDVTLTAATPPIVMGVHVGTAADGKCTALAGASALASAGSSAQLSGVASAGTLCVDVHDVGNQTAPVAYTVTVVHP